MCHFFLIVGTFPKLRGLIIHGSTIGPLSKPRRHFVLLVWNGASTGVSTPPAQQLYKNTLCASFRI